MWMHGFRHNLDGSRYGVKHAVRKDLSAFYLREVLKVFNHAFSFHEVLSVNALIVVVFMCLWHFVEVVGWFVTTILCRFLTWCGFKQLRDAIL